MTTFNYRAYNLPIDTCDSNDGYWLDGGEDKRVLELMKQRIKDLDRSAKAESEWFGFLSKLRRKR
jgi:Zn-finger nucleic acid-binding protein